jgi:hypothetical protein
MAARAPLAWLVIVLVLWGIGYLPAMLPRVWLANSLFNIVGVVTVGVLMRCCQSLHTGASVTGGILGTLALWPLWVVAVLAELTRMVMNVFALTFSINTITFMIKYWDMFFAETTAMHWVLSIAMFILLGMAFWLAPALVVVKRAGPLQAIKLSMVCSIRNIVPCIVFGLLSLVVYAVAAIPMIAGVLAGLRVDLCMMVALLILIPVMVCSSYLAFTDMFSE